MLRNREWRQLIFFISAIAFATILSGFFINVAAGVLSIFSSAAFCTTFLIFTKVRYQRIAHLSEEIDGILHSDDHLCIDGDGFEEGELSILHSEISKMTLRIREQNTALKKEKKHLADALADIAHQLRTPLTSINLILSLLKNTPDDKKRRGFLRESEALLMKMDWLITSLLKISRLDAGIVVFQKESVDVDHLVHDALHPLQIPMELHAIRLQISVPKGLTLTGDSKWLSEALQNILKNCMENAGEHREITLTCTDNPLYTEITIRDNGPGFESDALPHLFDRFYRGKNSDATGYGIGLALCKMIVTGQGGTILAKNHPHGGAFFRIHFPK